MQPFIKYPLTFKQTINLHFMSKLFISCVVFIIIIDIAWAGAPGAPKQTTKIACRVSQGVANVATYRPEAATPMHTYTSQGAYISNAAITNFYNGSNLNRIIGTTRGLVMINDAYSIRGAGLGDNQVFIDGYRIMK